MWVWIFESCLGSSVGGGEQIFYGWELRVTEGKIGFFGKESLHLSPVLTIRICIRK